MDVTIPGQIREHNASADAHSDIRQQIEDKAADIGHAMENAAVAAAAALFAHNVSIDAHKDVIDGVKRSVAHNAESIGNLRTDLDAESSNRTVAIENHNASPSAHADIRQALNLISAVAGIESSGPNYIRLKSGVQLCFGYANGAVSFDAKFSAQPYVVATVNSGASRVATITGTSVDGFTLSVWNNDGTKAASTFRSYWIAIGFCE